MFSVSSRLSLTLCRDTTSRDDGKEETRGLLQFLGSFLLAFFSLKNSCFSGFSFFLLQEFVVGFVSHYMFVSHALHTHIRLMIR